MKIETLGGAAIASVILFVTGFLAVFQQDGIQSVSDISEATWWVLGGGAALSFLKDYQALTVRRALTNVTRTGNLHSPPAVGILAVLLACLMLSGCGIQRPQTDSISDAIAVTAADVETAAQTVKDLCRNTIAGGPCATDALISTATKERLKRQLQDVLDGLRTADQLLAANASNTAQDRLSRTQALLAILSAELARLEN